MGPKFDAPARSELTRENPLAGGIHKDDERNTSVDIDDECAVTNVARSMLSMANGNRAVSPEPASSSRKKKKNHKKQINPTGLILNGNDMFRESEKDMELIESCIKLLNNSVQPLAPKMDYDTTISNIMKQFKEAKDGVKNAETDLERDFYNDAQEMAMK